MRNLFNFIYTTLIGYRVSIKKDNKTIQRNVILAEERSSVTEITIHHGVNKIKKYEFDGCTNVYNEPYWKNHKDRNYDVSFLESKEEIGYLCITATSKVRELH